MMAPWKALLISKGTHTKDNPPVTFEASASLVQIPQAEALLHAHCSGKKVTCEISCYFLQARQGAPVDTAASFIANVQLSGGGPSVSVVMKTLGDTENGAVLHPTLYLQGSGDYSDCRKTPTTTALFLATVEFQVTTRTPSLNFLLGSSASLHCRFSMAPGLALTGVEWRLQHKGDGKLVHSWTTGHRQVKWESAALEPEQLLMAGDASLTLPSLTLKDEGTYICQITTSLYQAQQIIQLHVQASPKVRLSLASEALLPTLTCSVSGYYPLDMTVIWIREELGGAPAPASGASFSSLQQSTMGTYSITSSLTAEPGSVGASYTCQVTHISLEEPLRASIRVALPGMDHIASWPCQGGPLGAAPEMIHAHSALPYRAENGLWSPFRQQSLISCTVVPGASETVSWLTEVCQHPVVLQVTTLLPQSKKE